MSWYTELLLYLSLRRKATACLIHFQVRFLGPVITKQHGQRLLLSETDIFCNAHGYMQTMHEPISCLVAFL